MIRVRDGLEHEVDDIARRNVRMALETENLALDIGTARAGAAAVFERNVGARYFIAERGDAVAGQLMITTEWSDWRDRPVWWIQSVYVEPDHRRQGVYAALYAHVTRAAEQAGAGGIRLYVDTRNTRAAGVYERLGMDGSHYKLYEAMFDEPEEAE